MDKEFAAKWVAALREEGRGQATGVLQIVDSEGKTGQCCLGVACEVLAKDGKLKAIDLPQHTGSKLVGYQASEEGITSSYTLAEDITVQMGVDLNRFGDTGLFRHIEGAQDYLTADERFAPAFKNGAGYPSELSSLNDRGVPFAAIADFIEHFADEL